MEMGPAETETGMAESWRGGGTLIFNFSTMRRRLGRVFLLFLAVCKFLLFSAAAATHTRVPCTLLPGLGLSSPIPRFLSPSAAVRAWSIVYGVWARSAQRDEWLAKMFECDHELDLSHNLKSQSQSLSQVKSSQLDALHTRHVNQAQRHGGSSSPPSFTGVPGRDPQTICPFSNGQPARVSAEA